MLKEIDPIKSEGLLEAAAKINGRKFLPQIGTERNQYQRAGRPRQSLPGKKKLLDDEGIPADHADLRKKNPFKEPGALANASAEICKVCG